MLNQNNRRIAKNALFLYFRMLLTMLISLFTVRIVLNALGVVDYGIYNVVGGIVVMLSFLSGTMASASERFFSFELGKDDLVQLKKTFSLTVTIYVIIAIIFLVIAETIGLWFLNTKLVIPINRIDAANWVYQFSVLSFLVTIIATPYNAAIIAHEDMKLYAYVSLIEVVMKLIIVYLLLLFSYDKLKLYAVLIFGTTLIIKSIYVTISHRKYEECRYTFFWDKKLFKTLLSYSSWNLFGTVSSILNSQGINIILNIFFGPVVNAARGISVQIQSAISGFIMNFQIAINPQIVKSYAKKDMEYMHSLIFASSRYSFFLMLLISLPVILEIEVILIWWLKIIPEHTINFVRLIMCTALVDTLVNPLAIGIEATGKVKKYQMIVGGLLMLSVPISYIVLKFGAEPEAVFLIHLLVVITAQVIRLFFIRSLIKISFNQYFSEVVAKILPVTIISIVLPILLINILPQNFISFILISIVSTLSVGISVFFLGINGTEKGFVIIKIYDLLQKIKILKK